MSVSEPFIRRPIATSLLGIALMIGGALGYWALPVSALPQVDFPTVQVTTQLPGASPDVIASLITAPLERQLGQIPSLSSMQSTSSFGVSQISLQFDLNRDIDGATQDVQAAINAAAGILPKNLPYPPTYAKVNPADAPVLTLALTSETISLRAMSDIADTILGQRLSQISGVGRVAILGGLKPAVRVQADLARLAAYGISMEDLRNAIAGANVSGPKGSLDGAQQAYTIAANDQIAAAEAYKPIIIAYRNGSPVTIGDVAIIIDGLENDRTGGWYQGTPAVIIDIQRQPGANVIEVVRQIREEIPKVQRAIPAGVNLTIVSDRTVTIRASVRDVQFTLILSVVLVTLVVLLFLRSLRATLIAGVALPLSLITSFGIMYFAGFSLDNLSLMALTIGTGFVVDDAIVMIENIVRHMENGESVMEASLKGASEIGFTVISLTVSLIAVFIPLLFMSGLVGRMFREFALTLTIAVVTSAIVSLTLTPMMCSRLLKHVGEEMTVPGLAAVSRVIDRMVAFYHRTLLWVLQRQRATLVVTFATIAATLVLYVIAPKGFLPLQDTASITAVTEAGPDVSFAEMQSRQATAAAAIQADPDVVGVVSVIGAGSVNPTTNVGRLVMTLQAARRAARRHFRRDRPAEATHRLDPRHDHLFPAGAGRADLDPVEPLAVPVYADRHRRGAGDAVVAEAGRRNAPGSAVPRRLVGSAGGRLARRARHQSPARRPARRQPPGGQRHAQRRLRAAADFDHLRPGQPVSRGAGGDADVPARSVDPVKALSAGRRECDRRRARRPGAAVGGGDADPHHRAAGDLASGAVSGGLAQLQPRARRGAGRCRRGGQDDRDAVSACPAASSASMRAMRPSSRNRWPASPG